MKPYEVKAKIFLLYYFFNKRLRSQQGTNKLTTIFFTHFFFGNQIVKLMGEEIKADDDYGKIKVREILEDKNTISASFCV